MKIETNEPIATVLIANYNNSKYIDQCLESEINQNYKKIEIVVVDETLQIIH
jgi:glycosyltransferase involved in cell wall biosynthesis